jgi:hypothetical protein
VLAKQYEARELACTAQTDKLGCEWCFGPEPVSDGDSEISPEEIRTLGLHLCSLHPPLERRVKGTKPGQPGSQGTEVPFVG